MTAAAPARTRDSAPSTTQRGLGWFESLSARRATVVVGLFFVVLTMFIFWPMWPGDPHRIVGCACGDPFLQSWFLGWAPWAILHGHNPFFTTYMDYPRGINLAANTLMPLLGVLFYPVTALAGATTTFSLLMWLSYPLSGLSAFHVVRRWSASNVGGLLAGLLYGFSPYILHQGYGHLNLTFVPLPPLIFYAVYKILVDQDGRARRWGLGLGLLLVAQYFIAAEVLVSTLLMSLVGAALWCALNASRLDRSRLRYVSRALGPGLAVVLVTVAYPVWYSYYGPDGIRIAYQGGISNLYRTDLLGVLVPTDQERVATTFLTSIGDRLTAGQIAENGSYLGAPLILSFLGCWIYFRRVRAVRLLGLLAVACWLLSLGPWLVVDGHPTSLPLPFYPLARLPGLVDLLTARFSLYVMFFVATTVAVGLARVVRSHLEADRRTRRSTRHRALVVTTTVLIASSLVALVPVAPIPTQSTASVTPAFFTSSDDQVIAPGSVVLTYPYAHPVYNQQAMYWQFNADFAWRMLGAYASIPRIAQNRTYHFVSVYPWPQPPEAVQKFLEYWEGYLQGSPSSGPAPLVTAQLARKTRTYLHRYRVATVVVELSSVESAQAIKLFQAALGAPTVEGGVALWDHLTARGL